MNPYIQPTPEEIELERLREKVRLMEKEREMRPKLEAERMTLLPEHLQLKYGESILPEIEKIYARVKPDTRALEALRAQALGTEMSPWATLALQQQQQAMASRAAQLPRAQAQAMAQTMSQLATRGGVSPQARAMLAQQMGRELMRQKAELASKGLEEQLGILGKEAGIRQEVLKALPSYELEYYKPELAKAEKLAGTLAAEKEARLKTEQFNIQKALETRLKEYEEAMKGYAAEQESKGMAESGGLTWICTELKTRELITPDDLKEIEKLKKYLIKNYEKLTNFYLQKCNKLIEEMKKKEFDWATLIEWKNELIKNIRENNFNNATKLYAEKLVELIEKYWEKCPKYFLNGLKKVIEKIEEKKRFNFINFSNYLERKKWQLKQSLPRC